MSAAFRFRASKGERPGQLLTDLTEQGTVPL